MNINQLYYFQTLAKYQHYTKASQELYISQPSLTHAIKELEKEKERLKQTIAIIDSILQDERINLKNLFNNFIGDREELWRIADGKKFI